MQPEFQYFQSRLAEQSQASTRLQRGMSMFYSLFLSRILGVCSPASSVFASSEIETLGNWPAQFTQHEAMHTTASALQNPTPATSSHKQTEQCLGVREHLPFHFATYLGAGRSLYRIGKSALQLARQQSHHSTQRPPTDCSIEERLRPSKQGR